MEQQENELDNLLAQLTDDVLNDEDVSVSNDQNPDLRVVKIMKELTSGTPSPEFRARLTDALNREWDSMQHQKRRTTTIAAWYNRPAARWIGVAAALVIVIGLLAALGPLKPGSDSGASLGDPGVLAVVVGILAAIGIIAAVWLNRRGQ